MNPNSELIWVLDSDPACISLYKQTLGLQYQFQTFEQVSELMNGLAEAHVDGKHPHLLIADPQTAKGSMRDYFNQLRANGNPPVPTPSVVIVSAADDLDLIRFYLKAGIRDYILKPIRPSELIAKIERALNHVSNREVLIMRNDLDGLQVNDLTFREHQLLTVFLSRPDRSILRDDLFSAIWGNVTVNRKTLDVHLFNLRRKIRPYGYDIICEKQNFSLRKQK